MKSFISCDPPSHCGKSNTWFTPPEIIKPLGEFDLDPCTESFRPFDTAKKHIEHDRGGCGLMQNWGGRVWLNPPYGNYTRDWLNKLRMHGNGIALVFSAIETQWGQDHAKRATGVYFLSGRVSFLDRYGVRSGNAGKGSCLFVYGNKNLDCLKNIRGVLLSA